MRFEVQVERFGTATRLVLLGELDLAALDEFDGAWRAAASQASVLVIDLRGLEFIDGAGLRCILEIHAASQADRFTLAVIRGGPDVQRVFAITGMEKRLPMVDDDSPLLRDQLHPIDDYAGKG